MLCTVSVEINTRPSAYEEVLDMAVNQPLVHEIFNIGRQRSRLKRIVALISACFEL